MKIGDIAVLISDISGECEMTVGALIVDRHDPDRVGDFYEFYYVCNSGIGTVVLPDNAVRILEAKK